MRASNVSLGIGLYVASPTGAAHAQSLWDFSYAASNGETLSGVLSGTDAGNDFTVTGLQALFVNGTNVLGDIPNPPSYRWTLKLGTVRV